MKQFFKFMFASMLGFFLTFVIILFLMIGVIASIATFSSKDDAPVQSGSVLQLTLSTELSDREGQNPFEAFDFMTMSLRKSIGLNELLNNIEKAKEDENIEGIFLDLTIVPSGWSSILEVRNALKDFRESGKFIISYGEAYMQSAYYLGSVADEMYLHPEGAIDFRGINSELVFLKNMLDKLGIDPQLVRHGEYKSAGEPLFREDMSPENREQIESYVGSIWNNVTGDIAESRGLTINHLNDVADGLLTRNARMAMENDMIDGIAYRDEILELLREKTNLEEDEDVKFVSLERYKRAPLPRHMITPRSRDQIAVVYASGGIIDGKGGENSIGSIDMSAAIREARKNESVKAIVFRINSPGGSALASDVILREVKLAAQEMPVIASMGDVAASGGYYIACAADEIIAHPNTITGSIGVFGMIPNMQEFFNDKIGLTFDNVKTNEFADMGSLTRPMRPAERQMIQGMIGDVYQTFIGHVAEGRGMPESVVDELGRGRVWSGAEARQNGLIDEFGGLKFAIERAASMAELEDYHIVEYPKRKDFLTQIMEDFGGIEERIIQRRLGDNYRYYRQINDASQMTGILTRMPYDIYLD